MQEIESTDAQSRLRLLERQLTVLEQAAQVFGAMGRGENVIGQLNRQVTELLDCEMSAILLYDADRQGLVGQAPAVGVPEAEIAAYFVPLGAGSPAKQYWETGEDILLTDTPTNPVVQMLGLSDFAARLGVRHSLMVGMRSQGQLVGVIQPSNKRDGAPFNYESDVRLLKIYASQAAVAIENSRLLEALRQEHQATLQLNTELESLVETQRSLLETLRELSSPVIPIFEGIIVLPLIGNIDTQRASDILEGLLAGIERYRAKAVLMDVTGVPIVDTSVANHLLKAAQAARLLGAEAVLVGVRPEVAQTMVQLGVAHLGLTTRADLQSGIEYAFARLNWRISRRQPV